MRARIYRSHYTLTEINGTSVGSHHWPLHSIRKYCQKKGIILKDIRYVAYDINYGFDYDCIDINTGKVILSYNNDPIKAMGL